MSELNLAISSRKSSASGLDNISPIMFKHLPSNALVSFLSIINNILTTNQVPSSWSSYRVIPIPKPNSNNSFCPIALSSYLCKVFEFMLKTRLACKPVCFQKRHGSMNYLSTFIGYIYHSFNNKEFFVATIVDIRSAFLQGSCYSPILFNVYMSIVEKHLSSWDHKCLMYADDLVIFSSNKFFNLTIDNLNFALKNLSNILIEVSFDIAPEKCKSIIFTRHRYLNNLNIFFNNNIIPFVPKITYLGITLDPKLHWVPHVTSLTTFTSRWSNFLRSVTGTWWGFQFFINIFINCTL